MSAKLGQIFIASDHAGYQLKKSLASFIEKELLFSITDLGPAKYEEDDDYPDYALPLAQKVAATKNGRGILICKNGIGVCIAANKVRGIRAGIGYNIDVAETMRQDDDTNIVCLPAKLLSADHARVIVKHWLASEFSHEERHTRRLKKIQKLDFMKVVEIIPTILVTDQSAFTKQVRGLEDSVDFIQIDIADGQFVPTVTWADPQVIKRELPFHCELHLMAQDPISIMEEWAMAPQVKRVLVHYESQLDFNEILSFCQSRGWEIGLALNPLTSIDAVAPHAAALQRLMLMGVEPGRQGQAFIPQTLDRIRSCKAKYIGLPVAVDGAVSEATLPGIMAAGADAVCIGSAIFGNELPPAENVRRLKKLVERLTDRSRTGSM